MKPTIEQANDAKKAILRLNEPGVVKGLPPIKSAQVVLSDNGFRVDVIVNHPYGPNVVTAKINGVPILVLGRE